MKEEIMAVVKKGSEGKEGRGDRMQQTCMTEEEKEDVKESNGRRCWN